ncbi:porin [Microbulbifer halophilus]|uniref:Porin n=1 Tax=Microbulbifer halophilus TaxID=453963 RepID=A0ABW5EE39_9GAMM|nr:porin [Microbulbifer halophilus]MCW8127332.1 porin [Microbulbifer halophilus]
MHKNLYRGLIALAACVAIGARALPVYESQEVALYMQGYFTTHQLNINGNTSLVDGPSRIGFNLDVPAYDEWNVGFNIEWGIQAVSPNQQVVISGDQQAAPGEQAAPLYTRQGHAYAKHDLWGDFAAGKQWAVYYDVAGITDWYNVSGGLASGAYALGTDGGITGTGRANGALTWRKRWEGFGGEFQVGLQYAAHTADLDIEVEDVAGPDTLLVCPPGDCEYGISRGASLTYELDIGSGLLLGTAYNRVNLDISTDRGQVFDISDPNNPVLIRSDRVIRASSNDFAFIGGIAYGKGAFQQGLYAAFNWQRSHNNELAPPSSTMGATNFFNAIGSESFVSYTWGNLNCYSLYGGHNLLKSHDDEIFEEALITGDGYRLGKYFLGFNYRWNERVRLYLEAAEDDSNEVAQQNNGFIAVGIRVDI